jgi:hypothetical protein
MELGSRKPPCSLIKSLSNAQQVTEEFKEASKKKEPLGIIKLF